MGADVVVVVLSSIWLASGAGKLGAPRQATLFLGQVVGNQAIGLAWLVRAVAIVEIATAVGLGIPQSRHIAVLVSTGLAGTFTVLLVYTKLMKGLTVACGCFGTNIGPNDSLQAILLVAIAACTVSLFFIPPSGGYLGLYSQFAVLDLTVILRVTQFLRLRRSIVYAQLPTSPLDAVSGKA